MLSWRICGWLILFQEFDFEVIFRLGRLNSGPENLSRLQSGEERVNLKDSLPDAQLFAITMFDDHYRDIIQFLSTRYAPKWFSITQKKQLVVQATNFQLIAGQLYKMGPDEILCHCVLEHEWPMTLNEVHAGVAGGHYAGKAILRKILQAGLWWPTVHADAREYCRNCDICQRIE